MLINIYFIFLYMYIYIYYLLTPWCRVLLEKLTGLQLVKKYIYIFIFIIIYIIINYENLRTIILM